MSNIRYAHLRRDPTSNKKGGWTVAWTENGPTISYAVARCHKRDDFVRAEGRRLATERLVKGRQSSSFNLTFETDVREIPTHEILDAVQDDFNARLNDEWAARTAAEEEQQITDALNALSSVMMGAR